MPIRPDNSRSGLGNWRRPASRSDQGDKYHVRADDNDPQLDSLRQQGGGEGGERPKTRSDAPVPSGAPGQEGPSYWEVKHALDKGRDSEFFKLIGFDSNNPTSGTPMKKAVKAKPKDDLDDIETWRSALNKP